MIVFLFSFNFIFSIAIDVLIAIAMFVGAAAVYEWLTLHFIWVLFAFIAITILECIACKSINKNEIDYSRKVYYIFIVLNNILFLSTLYLMLFKMQTFSAEHGFSYILCMICALGTFGGTFFGSFCSAASDVATFNLSISIISLLIMLVSTLVSDSLLKVLLCALSAFFGLVTLAGVANE